MTAHVSAHYTPAAEGWVALVSGRRAVLLDEAAISGRSDAVLDALDSDDAVGALLGLLMRDGLAAMPGFAFTEVDDSGSRVLVRGEVIAELGGTEYRGADYSTWGEHRAESSAVSLRAASRPAGMSGSELSLPLARGAAFAHTLSLAADGERRMPDASPAAAESQESPAPAAASAAVAAPPAAPAATPPAPAAAPAVEVLPVPISPPPSVAPAPSSPSTVPEQTMVEFTVADADPGYSHLFEETIVRPIEHAAVREDETEAIVDAPAAVPVGTGFQEHDGLTIVSGELAKLRADAPRQQTDPLPVASGSRPPAIAELRFSSGIVEKLTGPVIVGRSPSSGKVSAGRLPRLVTITDDPDLSRSHVQIEMQGDAVVVTDLHSRNGTTVALPGRSPERLRGGVPTTVMDRTLIDLGGGLTIEVREPLGADA